MVKNAKRFTAVALTAAMAFSLVACGGSGSGDQTTKKPSGEQTTQSGSEKPAETVVIRYGTHWINDLDPNYVDPVTGEYTMSESNRQAALAGLEAIKEAYNVEFEFLQYPNDVLSDLMTSVMAGNPICELANLWGGSESTILAQNVLQQLDSYESLFADEETSWMFDDKLYGHNYLLSSKVVLKQRWPLIFNISMIEQVDALKDENGKTIYPMDLFLDGKWTWSTFTDYLTKIQAHYASVQAPEGVYHDTVVAYETDYRFAGLSAMYSAGGMIYGSKGLYPDGAESIKGAQYIEELMQKGLLVDPNVYDDGWTPRWCEASDHFSKGGTVFTDSPDWWIGGNASSCSERGESIGMVPWPRPDDMPFDSEDYKQVNTISDSIGVLKGVSEEKTELAIKSFILYWQTYYKTLGGTDTMAEYKEQCALTEMANIGLDIYNEEYGDKIVECFNFIGTHLGDDYADLLGIRGTWDTIIGKSLYGVDGMSAYDVSVKANMNEFNNVIANMEAILSSNEIRDNRAPSISKETAVVPAGTDLSTFDWTPFFTAEDAVDGVLGGDSITIEVQEGLDVNTVGTYGDAVKVIAKDSSDNEGNTKLTVVVYDPNNKTAPTAEAKADAPEVTVDTDASTIDWKNYVSATDASGLDLSERLSADLSELDTTAAGTYNVDVTVEDYAGNTTVVTVTVTVVEAE